MKTFKGTELIKAAKYLEKLGTDRPLIEQDFTIDSVDVEDRKATVHYIGTVEGVDAQLDVAVYKAKSYENWYYATMAGQQFNDKEYNKVNIWLHSITRLDTEEARNGTLKLLPEQWRIVHKDVMKKFFKDFRIEKHQSKWWPEEFVEFRYLDHGSFYHFDSAFGLILLEYDPKLKDFKQSFNDYQFHVDLGMSNDATRLAVGYYLHDCAPALNAALKAVLPMAKNGECKIIQHYGGYSDYYYVDGTHEEILEICKGMKDRLFEYYDGIIKASGGNPNWRKATGWEESGPVYPAESDDAVKAKELLDAKEADAKQSSIDRVAKVAKQFFDIDIKTFFKDSTIECQSYEFADTVIIKVPYKFPKVSGSKVVMQDKVLEISLYRDDYPYYNGSDSRYNELTVTYHVPGIYGTMRGEFIDFSDAVTNDSEKLMTLKPTRKTFRYFASGRYGTESGSCFSTIRKSIDDLDAYLKYKGYTAKTPNGWQK